MTKRKPGRPKIYPDAKARRREYMRIYRLKEKQHASEIRENQAIGTEVGQAIEGSRTDSGCDVQQGTTEGSNTDGAKL